MVGFSVSADCGRVDVEMELEEGIAIRIHRVVIWDQPFWHGYYKVRSIYCLAYLKVVGGIFEVTCCYQDFAIFRFFRVEIAGVRSREMLYGIFTILVGSEPLLIYY